MNREQKRLIESLKSEVVLPAKSRLLNGEKVEKLMQSNYRFRGQNEKSIWEWFCKFKANKLNLEEELRKLVKTEIGNEYDVNFCGFSGYLGVTSNTYFDLVKK